MAQDTVWSARDTTPADDRGGAARACSRSATRENAGFVAGARAEPRLRRRPRVDAARSPTGCAASGRYHASRTIVCAVEPRPHDARRASRRSRRTVDPKPGEFALLRETIVVRVRRAPPRAPRLDRRPARRHRPADPASGRRTATTRPSTRCSALAQVVLLDSRRRARRARRAARASRSFARARRLRRRPRLAALDAVARARRRVVRPAALRARAAARSRRSTSATTRDSALGGAAPGSAGWPRAWAGGPSALVAARRRPARASARARRQDVHAAARADPTLRRARPRRPRRSRPPTGRHALARPRPRRAARALPQPRTATQREWTVLGASRGEAGILGEGIRQALLRDPTYRPRAEPRPATLVPMKGSSLGDVPLGGSPFPPIADYAFLSDCEVTRARRAERQRRVDVPAAPGRPVASSARCSTATPAASGSAPADTTVPAGRRYLPGTMVLETTWGTRTGWVIVRDVLLIGPVAPRATSARTRTAARRPTTTPTTSCCARCAASTARSRCTWTASRCSTTAARTSSWEYTGDGLPRRRRRRAEGDDVELDADDRPAPRLRGRARPRAHDDARGRHRVRRAVVDRARRRRRPTTRPTSALVRTADFWHEWLVARRLPRPPVADATCSAAR